MRLLSLILVIAVAASSMGGMKMPQVNKPDPHSCCKTDHSPGKDKSNDCGTCLMACCRIVSVPADRIGGMLLSDDVAADVILPPLTANDRAEPGSIFHPPRA